MNAKHAVVIDSNGYKTEFALVSIEETEDGQRETPLYYILQDGESLIYEDIPAALSMYKPRWNSGAWEETATLEETAAVEAARLEMLHF